MPRTSTHSRLDRLIAISERRFVGPRLYLLSAHQRAIWDKHQQEQSEIIETYEFKHGPHSYIKAVFDDHDPCANHHLPNSIRQVLGLDREPPGIPLSASTALAQRIFEDYLDE